MEYFNKLDHIVMTLEEMIKETDRMITSDERVDVILLSVLRDRLSISESLIKTFVDVTRGKLICGTRNGSS